MCLFPMLSEDLVHQQDLYRYCTYYVEKPILDTIASWSLKKTSSKTVKMVPSLCRELAATAVPLEAS